MTNSIIKIVLACGVAVASAFIPPTEGAMAYSGTCARFDGTVIVFACAPSQSPDGEPILDLFEDGSANYPGWSYDGDTMTWTDKSFD